MAVCDIAGLKVDIKNLCGRTAKQAAPYLSGNQDENQHIDITIDVTKKRVEEAMAEHPELNSDDWEYMLTGQDFYTRLIRFDGILLHSSCVVVDGYAYAFSADSGVGKSTHTQLWLKHFGDRAWNVPSRINNCNISMLIEKINAIFPLSHSIFFQPFPIFSPNVHITTELNGTIIITFSMHSVVSFVE